MCMYSDAVRQLQFVASTFNDTVAANAGVVACMHVTEYGCSQTDLPGVHERTLRKRADLCKKQ